MESRRVTEVNISVQVAGRRGIFKREEVGQEAPVITESQKLGPSQQPGLSEMMVRTTVE